MPTLQPRFEMFIPSIDDEHSQQSRDVEEVDSTSDSEDSVHDYVEFLNIEIVEDAEGSKCTPLKQPQ